MPLICDDMTLLSACCSLLFSSLKFAAKEAVGADETPCGGWLVTRLRTAAHGTVNLPSLSLAIGPRGGLGDHGDTVSRQLILTKVSLVERRPANYEVAILNHLAFEFSIYMVFLNVLFVYLICVCSSQFFLVKMFTLMFPEIHFSHPFVIFLSISSCHSILCQEL